MASGELFVVYECIPGLSFCSFWAFSFGNSVSLYLHFFLCGYVLFYVFAIRNSSLIIVAFFVAMVLGLLVWFFCVYFYFLSSCKVVLLSGRVNT
mgnify:CR=1 FL=1